MKKCVIFCAGEFKEPIELIGNEDIVIAADGGLEHVRLLHLVPDVILGDFDSLGYVPEGAAVFPVEKDDTDCMLAIKQGLEMGCGRFVIYGGMDGARVDHTMANFQALLYLAERGCRGWLVGRRQIATVIRKERIEFPERCSGTLSVFCLGGDARGVDISGVHYTLENGTLTAGMPLGVSNKFIGQRAQISVADGALLLVWDKANGLQ